mmetsp:Transcript_32579/g.75980  ORF Transcript_32579/g.75980 Transcript_32579/m.75980 type:complete len:80 (+) Transcript_32579:473-712(+)
MHQCRWKEREVCICENNQQETAGPPDGEARLAMLHEIEEQSAPANRHNKVIGAGVRSSMQQRGVSASDTETGEERRLQR